MLKIMKQLLFAFLLLLAACSAPSDKIIVGAILPLSGAFAFYGQDGQNALALAQEDIGDKITFIYEDSAGDNTKAIAAFNKLTNIDGAKIVITSTSWISNAVYSQAADQNVLQGIIASAGFTRTRNDSKAVRATVDVKEEAAFLVQHLDKYNRVANLHLNNDYGKGWAESLKTRLGAKVVATESYAPGDTDVSTQLAKIKAANPDVLVLTSTGKEGGLFAKKAREQGITVPLVSQRPIQSPELLQEAKAVEGLVYSYPAYNAGHAFVTRYKEKFGKEPTVFAVEAYDLAILLAQAAESCGEDTACIYAWFQGREHDGALGHIDFDKTGDAHYPFQLKHVTNSQFVTYQQAVASH
jgi:branched-chain amino acid transport system substrate-binding protein